MLFKYGFLSKSDGNLGTWANTFDIEQNGNNASQARLYRHGVYVVPLCNEA